MEVTLLSSIISGLNYIVSCGLESRLWFDLYLGRDIKKQLSTQQSLLLEVRKLEKIEGVAYLEGLFKSNKYTVFI